MPLSQSSSVAPMPSAIPSEANTGSLSLHLQHLSSSAGGLSSSPPPPPAGAVAGQGQLVKPTVVNTSKHMVMSPAAKVRCLGLWGGWREGWMDRGR